MNPSRPSRILRLQKACASSRNYLTKRLGVVLDCLEESTHSIGHAHYPLASVTTMMAGMKATITILQDAGLRFTVKGTTGALLTEECAVLISADGFASSASRAVTLAKSFFKRD